MADTLNNDIIEELAKTVNSSYDAQKRLLERYTNDFNKAQENGATKEYLAVLSGEIGKIEASLKSQEESAASFYEEMVQLAGGRTDLDKKMLEDVMKYREMFVKTQEQIRKLIESFNNEQSKVDENGNNISNAAELARIQKNIVEQQTKLDKAYKTLESNYGKDSYATIAADNFAGDAQAQEELLGKINDREKQSVGNNKEIGKAMAANNAKLEKGLMAWNAIKAAASDIWKEVKDGGNMWMKYNAQAISDAKRLGFTSKEHAREYTEYLMESSKQLSRNFGMTAEQAMKMQESFSKATGKASMLTQSQMEDIAASSKLMGEETVNSAIEMMDSMGTTSQTTTELLDKNYARAVNSGLDTVKASEAFVKNMSLANKLTFKSGVDGISKMTILSQRIKLNLQEVANVADKFSTIEGAIEGSAQLQMLGGAGAMFGGNPMQMMYEAMSDPEALFQRMGKMFGEQARFDRKTGEAKIDPLQMQIMREQAKAMGMNPDEAVQTAKQQAKIKDIEASNRELVNRYGKDSEEMAAIENKAQFNKEKGVWEVAYMDETGEMQNVGVHELTPEIMEQIMKDNIDPVQDIRGRVKEIAMTLVGTKERLDAMKDQWRTAKAQGMNGIMETFDTGLTDASNGEGPLGSLWHAITDGGVGTWASIIGKGLGVGLTSYIGARFGKGLLNNITGRLGGGGGSSATGGGSRLGRFFGRGGSGGVNAGNAAAGATNTVRGAGSVASEVGAGARATRVGATASETASAVRAGKSIKTLRNLAKAKNAVKGAGTALKVGAKGIGKVAGPLAVLADVGFAAYDYYQAGEERKQTEQIINARQEVTNNLTGRKRYSQHEIDEQRIEANNKESKDKGEAIGAGTGALAGAAAGAAVGSVVPVIGTAIGAAVGGIIGGIAGAFAGRNIASEEETDTVAKELEAINDSDEEENLRRIVLPIESIDYNVSLIANQLGILSAMPARGNVYLAAEEAGEIQVEGVPLQAGSVNPVDTNYVPQQTYVGGGTVNLNINGTIELTGGGKGVGKLTAQDIKQIFDNSPELQRQIADIITGRQGRNGNAGRNNYENGDNRRGTTNGTYNGGL